MEALGINLGYLIMQILIITVMMLLLKGLVYKPIIKNLEERKARIAKGMEDSRQAAIARDNADAEAEKIMDEARQEAVRIRQDAVTQAEETAAAIEAKANEDAKEIVAKASGATATLQVAEARPGSPSTVTATDITNSMTAVEVAIIAPKSR